MLSWSGFFRAEGGSGVIAVGISVVVSFHSSLHITQYPLHLAKMPDVPVSPAAPGASASSTKTFTIADLKENGTREKFYMLLHDKGEFLVLYFGCSRRETLMRSGGWRDRSMSRGCGGILRNRDLTDEDSACSRGRWG